MDLVSYVNATCFSHVHSTFIKATNNIQYNTWPGLTSELLPKHLSKIIATTKGHINQDYQKSQ